MIKQTGKVMTDASKILPVIFLLMYSFLQVAQPMIDKDFTFPVLIGIPKAEQRAIVKNEPMSEENEPW